MNQDGPIMREKRQWANRGQTVRQALERLEECVQESPDSSDVRGFLVATKPRVASLARAWNLACRVPGVKHPLTSVQRMDEEFRSRILELWSVTQDLEEQSRSRAKINHSEFLARVEWLRGDVLTWIASFRQSGRVHLGAGQDS
jgi:hypothetical protein